MSESIDKQVIKALDTIELQHNVRILGAVESGSRAWGFSSANSDYDVRFIYCRPLSAYLSLGPDSAVDTIERKFPWDLDVAGWDIRKALKLGLRHNPSLIEWSQSPVQYAGRRFWVKLNQLLRSAYHYQSNVRAYHGMAKGNYIKYVKGRELVSYKRYLYVLRPLLVADWILFRREMPPIEFDEVRFTGKKELDAAIDELLALKRSGDEMGVGPRITAIDSYIEAALSQRLPSDKASLGERSGWLPDFQDFLFSYIL